MYAYIKGFVQSYGSDHVIVENNGIGYYIFYVHPENLGLNKEVTIYTYQNVREDEISLFGFSSVKEKELFLSLISVKGVGPRTALTVLSFITVEELVAAIEQENVTVLKKLPGIGGKTASQIILDLKGKLVAQETVALPKNRTLEDALVALKSLGYKQREINDIISELQLLENGTVDAYVKYGLQLLLKKKGG